MLVCCQVKGQVDLQDSSGLSYNEIFLRDIKVKTGCLGTNVAKKEPSFKNIPFLNILSNDLGFAG
jgi:hypothetical protein